MRVALRSLIREAHEAGYERDHQTIPADLVASFDRLGIRDWTIWRDGRDLFHVVDCDDFGAAMRALDEDPANQRWQEFIDQHVQSFVGGDGEPEEMILGEVWRLQDQRAGS